jgi:hypothetical protein
MYLDTMAQNQPSWLKMVHRVERAVGSHVETFVTSETYFDLLAQATKARRRLLQATESLSSEWLHFWNLPASSDVRRLREQLSRVERTLADVAKEVNDRAENGARPKPDERQ